MSGRLFVGDSHTWAQMPWVTDSFADQLEGVNSGWPGAMTATALSDFWEKIDPFLARAQHVSILLGTNDAIYDWNAAEYEQRLRDLAGLLLSDSRRVWINAPWHAGPAYAVARVNEATQIVASLWGQDGIESTGYLGVFDPPQLEDGVHPSQAGHDHIAAKLAANLTGF